MTTKLFLKEKAICVNVVLFSMKTMFVTALRLVSTFIYFFKLESFTPLIFLKLLPLFSLFYKYNLRDTDNKFVVIVLYQRIYSNYISDSMSFVLFNVIFH